MNYRNLFKVGFLLFSMLFIVSCSEDDDDNMEPSAETYNTTVEVTDAPIDNANVKGAFVTIANVKINGKALEGFQTTTVDLLALQNGTTKVLGEVALEAGTTSNIVVELTNEADDQGGEVANYVLLEGGQKVELVLENTEIALTDAAEVVANADNTIVLDFDLRKMIGKDSEGQFQLVSQSELQASIRAVNKLNAAAIEGNVEDTNNTAEAIVVYAYKKGTYTESEATENANGVRFSGAVNSSLVSQADGSYSLNYLEEGEYELHYAAYSEDETTGMLSFQGMLAVTAASGFDLDIFGLNLAAESTTELDVVVTGMVQ
jgi:uncharacterized cupredoxin-like copper-binding protein